MAKNMHDAFFSMLKAISDMKKEKEEKRAKLVAGMKLAESSVDIGLEDVRISNIHEPPKISTHSTNFSSRENATTISVLLLAGRCSQTNKNNKNNPFTPTQD